jgi:O-antigen/teichoic acid export membrane protein
MIGPALGRVRAASGGTLWLLAGQSAWAGAQWVVVLAATRWTSPAVVGLYALALGTSTPVFRFFNSGLRLYASADLQARFGRRAYVNSRLIGLLAAVAVSLAAWGVHTQAHGLALMAAVVAAKAIDAMSDLTYGFAQRHGRFARVGGSMMARALLGGAAAVGLLAWTGSLTWAVVGMAAAWLAMFVAVDRHAIEDDDRAGGPAAEAGQSLTLMKRVAPLAFVAALSAAFGYVPVYLLSVESSTAAGVFAAIHFLAMPATLLGVAWGQANLRAFAAARADAPALRARLGGAAAAFVGLGVAGMAAAGWLGPWLIERLYGPAYAEHAGLLPWLMLAAGVSCVSTTLSYASTAIDRIAWQPVLLAVAIGVVAGSGWLLIPWVGLTAAAVALCVGYTVHAVLLSIYVLGRPVAAGATTGPRSDG